MTSKEHQGWRTRLATFLSHSSAVPPAPASAPGEEYPEPESDDGVFNDEDDERDSASPDDADTELSPDRKRHSHSRDVVIDGKTYEVPYGIKPTEFGWRARWVKLGYARQFWRFEEPDLSREEKLIQAKAWLAMSHPREFVVERIADSGGNGSERFTPRFRIRIENLRGQYGERWMTDHINGIWYITQDRIDEVIERMHRRLDHYEVRRMTMSHEKAIEFRIRDVDPSLILHPDQKPMRLKLHDLLAWTGEAQGVRFDPSQETAAGRTRLYWPELQDLIQERCPTIDVGL
ncbi:MAG: hypothetical protein BGP25_05610 [Lysobacterales bacterium 63-13]|nr:MAG: hypothetical protein BGP25_05610 [Xanthomonadales bacterium 63-13]